MTRNDTDRRSATGRTTWSRKTTSLACWLVAGAMIVAVSPSAVHAQFWRIKKLKERFSAPDSSARAKDSLEQIAAGVKPESVKVGKSMLQKGAAIVSTANGALESATGLSAKDAALAATGIGASNLMAKKMGLDPLSIGARALANAKMGAAQRAAQRSAMANATAARSSRVATANAMADNRAMAGYSQADVDALRAFEQEMTRLSVAASAGDASAQARLAAWEALVLKHNPDVERLSMAASAGNVDAVQKLQRLQFDMMKEWSPEGSAKSPAKIK